MKIRAMYYLVSDKHPEGMPLGGPYGTVEQCRERAEELEVELDDEVLEFPTVSRED